MKVIKTIVIMFLSVALLPVTALFIALTIGNGGEMPFENWEKQLHNYR